MPLIVPNSDCRTLLSIIGIRKARYAFHSGRAAVMIESLRELDGTAESEFIDVVADVIRPAGDQVCQPPLVVGVQRARGFLEVSKIARHRGHEMIGGVARCAVAIPV